MYKTSQTNGIKDTDHALLLT